MNVISIEIKKLYTVVFLVSLYLTLSLATDLLAFRLVDIAGFITGGAFFFPALYIILDVLTRISGRKFTINLILIFHLMDFVFIYTMYFANLLPAPPGFNLEIFNSIISPVPRLLWSSCFGSIFAGIADVFLFSFIRKKIKSFFFASYFSTVVILLIHDVPTDYFSLKPIFPDCYWKVIFGNFTESMISVIIFSAISNFFLTKSFHLYRLKNKIGSKGFHENALSKT